MSSDGYINADIGKGHKDKLREIAQKQERNMTGQLRIMIDDYYQKVIQNND